ncbi:MAG: hypothetical protein HQ464_02010 [Planctomycetes bacterium]|nr:hypothetical protein [Planctomycetota bacterium]
MTPDTPNAHDAHDNTDQTPESARPAAEKNPVSAATKRPKHAAKKKPATKTKNNPTKNNQAKNNPTKNNPTNKKPAEKITSKAGLIRKVAGIIKAKGEKPRPSEIVKILQEEGVTVAPAQVSMTLKAAGYRPLRKRQKVKKAAGGIAAKKTAAAGRSNQISIDDLLAAKSVSGAFGGTDKAIAALQALKQFEN